MIITADGNIDFFDEVESLVAQAPVLEHWNIIALKPPKDSVFTATYISTIIDPKTLSP